MLYIFISCKVFTLSTVHTHIYFDYFTSASLLSGHMFETKAWWYKYKNITYREGTQFTVLDLNHIAQP